MPRHIPLSDVQLRVACITAGPNSAPINSAFYADEIPAARRNLELHLSRDLETANRNYSILPLSCRLKVMRHYATKQ
jgi:hypothetical protein